MHGDNGRHALLHTWVTGTNRYISRKNDLRRSEVFAKGWSFSQIFFPGTPAFNNKVKLFEPHAVKENYLAIVLVPDSMAVANQRACETTLKNITDFHDAMEYLIISSNARTSSGEKAMQTNHRCLRGTSLRASFSFTWPSIFFLYPELICFALKMPARGIS